MTAISRRRAPSRALRALQCSLAAGAFACATAPATHAATVVSSFKAAADARVEGSKPSTNFGTSRSLVSDGSPTADSYLKFSVANLSGTVQSAKLRVHVTDGSNNGPALFTTGTSWSETGVTYGSRPGRTSGALVNKASVSLGWLEYDVTAAVKGNGAFSFDLGADSNDAVRMDSRETAYAPELVVSTLVPDPAPVPEPAPTGKTYYVDSAAGSDSNAGTSTSSAWRTLAKATSATLAPGDRLLFKRGLAWSGKLDMRESGTALAPIQVGAYGTGDRPVVGGGTGTCVAVNGSYVQVRGLRIGGCTWAGVDIVGDYAVVEDNYITDNVVGVSVKEGSGWGKVLRNEIRDNRRMSVLTSGGDDDSGAFGLLLHGEDTEVAHNTISGHSAFSYDYGQDGAAVEVYGAIRNHIHHNVAVDNQAFSELGDPRSANNTFAYNEIRSSLSRSTGIITRGESASWGRVAGTALYNNTIYLSGSSSQGVICHGGCGPDILKMRNNIVQATAKAVYADYAFDEDYDVFFGGQVQMPSRGSHTVVADPRFVSPSTGDLKLQSTSPAVDLGVALGYSSDLRGMSIPFDGNVDGIAGVDRGANERH